MPYLKTREYTTQTFRKRMISLFILQKTTNNATFDIPYLFLKYNLEPHFVTF